ncbi:MAG TPA: Dabb family protein [Verrucomicrobiales bacterium]|nr:Dabb family protein [Verrucomicrobiales bacterium]
MLIHTVYFWLSAEAREEHGEEFPEALRDLLRIDRIRAGFLGSPASTERRLVTDHSFDFSIHLHFDSQEDHDAYQDDPEHHRFVERCRAWWEKVVVYDSEGLGETSGS